MVNKRSSTSKNPKSRKKNTNESRPKELGIATQKLFLLTLKEMIGLIIAQCPKKILIEDYQYINKVLPEMKDRHLTLYVSTSSVKKRRKCGMMF